MKNLCLVYEDESSWAKVPKQETDAMMSEYGAFTHSARADLCRRLGRSSEAIASYRRALGLTRLTHQRHFLEGRIRDLAG